MSLPNFLLHLFIPHELNNFRAKVIHPFPISLFALLVVLLQILLSSLPKFTPIVLGYESSINPGKIIELANKERVKAGVGELTSNPLLTQAALAKASDMMARNYWAHNSPDGKEPWRFVTGSGYQYRFAGENLARDFSNSEDVVSAWVNSPSHKENLISPRYQDIGVAVVEGELGGVKTALVVQFFGTKMSQAAVVEKRLTTTSGVLAKTEEKKLVIPSSWGVLVSPASVVKNMTLAFTVLFIVVFLIDMVIISRKNIARASSKSLAHFLFFGMILIVVLAAKEGLIK